MEKSGLAPVIGLLLFGAASVFPGDAFGQLCISICERDQRGQPQGCRIECRIFGGIGGGGGGGGGFGFFESFVPPDVNDFVESPTDPASPTDKDPHAVCGLGNPIIPSTGNKVETETDFVTDGGEMNAPEFGNSIAGYAGAHAGGRFGLAGVLAGGIWFDAVDAFHGSGKFDLDADSVTDIYRDAFRAKQERRGNIDPARCECRSGQWWSLLRLLLLLLR